MRMASDKKITPTLTLAQLYDAQRQYFDAYIIYKKLYTASPSDDLKDRMATVERKIFSDLNLNYEDVISHIFTKEDLNKFKIVPTNNYQNLKQALSDEPVEPIEFVDTEIEEEENSSAEVEDIEIEYPGAPVYPNEKDDRSHKETKPYNLEEIYDVNTPDLSNLTISELSQHIIKKINQDKKILDLTLKEVKEIKTLIKDLF